MANPWDVFGNVEEEPENAPPLSAGQPTGNPWDVFAAPAPGGPQVSESTTPAPRELAPVDFKQDPAFAQLFSLRQNRANFAGNPVAGAQAQQQDRALVEQLSRTYDVTEAEIAQELTGLVRGAAQRDANNPLVQEQARLEATVADPNLEATRISTPEYDERRQRAREIAGARFGGAMRMAAETLEPLQYVQDVAGTIYNADMSTLDLPVGEKLGRVWSEVSKLDEGKYFDSLNPIKYWGGTTQSVRRNYSGEENVRLTARAFGIEDKIPDSAYKVAGLGADVFVDPLVFGSFLRVGGRLLKVGAKAGARAGAGDNLIKLGDDVEKALSPATLGRGVARVTPQPVKDAITDRLEMVVADMMNKTAPAFMAGGKPGTRWAQHLSGTGSMPWNRERDVMSGVYTFDEIARVGEKNVAEVYNRGPSGTERPKGLQDSMTRAEYQSEVGTDRMYEAFKRIYTTLGNDRAANWMKGIGDNLMRFRKIADDPKFHKYDQAEHDALVIGAMDVVKDMGITELPGARRERVLSRLDESRQANNTARDLWKGRSVVGDTVGAEVRKLAADAPESVSLIERETRARLTQVAERKGLDVNKYLQDYDDVVDELMAADIELGYRNTLYSPIKDTFYEEMARRGASFEAADATWQAMAKAAMRGEDVDTIGLTADYMPATYGRSMEASGRGETWKPDMAEDVVGTENYNAALDADEAPDIIMRTGDVMNRITKGAGIDLNDWWRDIARGHFRNTYAAFQSKRGGNHAEKLIKALGAGEVIRAPLLHDGLYRKGLVSAGFERESALITQYVEQISPTRKGSRGLMIRQSHIAQHLVDSGIPPARVNEVMQKLMSEMAPLNMREMVGGVERTASILRAKAGQTQTGYGIGAERNRPPYPEPLNVEYIRNPEGFPEDFPQAIIPADADGATRKALRDEHTRLGKIGARLAEINREAGVSAGSRDWARDRTPVNPPPAGMSVPVEANIPKPTVNPADLTRRIDPTLPRVDQMLRAQGKVVESTTAAGGGVKDAYAYAGDGQVRQFIAENKYAGPWYRNRLGHNNDPADLWGAARFEVRDGRPEAARTYAERGLAEAQRRGDTEAVSAFSEFLGDLQGRNLRVTTPVVDASNARTGTPLANQPDPYYRGVDTINRSGTTPTGTPPGFVEGQTRLPDELQREAASLYQEMEMIRANRETRTNVSVGEAADLSRKEWERRMAKSEESASILGQLYDPMTSLGEGAEYLKRHMPAKQFLLDTYTVARRGDYIKEYSPGTDKTPETPIPEGYVRIKDDPKYGPFANTVTHKYLANEVENALLSDAEGRMSALGRLASAVAGGKLASPLSVANNFIGGLYVGHLYGSNPVDVLSELKVVLADAKKAGERGKLADMDAIGHLMGGQSKALALAQMIDGGKLDISGIKDPQTMQKLTRWYGDALKKPMGQGWAGLDWFQATEDLLKIANYRVALKKFDGDQAKAVEYTRNVLFDYTALPEATRQLRDYGLLTFPGFPMFMASRTLGTVIQNPGRIMPYERLPEAVWNALADDEDLQYAAGAGMAQWQFENKSVPYRVREGVGGHIVDMMALGAWFPTNQLDRRNLTSPVTDSLATGGWLRPLFDVASASWTGTGEAPFSARYGQRVFRPGMNRGEKAAHMAGFLTQQYAPSAITRTVNYNPNKVDPNDELGMQSPWGGIAPSVLHATRPQWEEGAREVWKGMNLDEMAPGLTEIVNRNIFPMDENFANSLRKIQEGERTKREKDVFANAASTILPGASVLSLEPQTANARRKTYGYEVERAHVEDELEIDLINELQLAAQGRASKPAIMAILDKGRQLGVEKVTLPSGEVLPLLPEMYDAIASVNYWETYKQNHPEQGVR